MDALEMDDVVVMDTHPKYQMIPHEASSTRNCRDTSTKCYTFSQNHVVHFVQNLQPPHDDI